MKKQNDKKNIQLHAINSFNKGVSKDYDHNFIPFELSLILKGIAILLVAICHLGGEFTRWATPLGGIGVAVFLILSAYGLEKSYQRSELHHYWRKRLLAVWIPYMIIEVATFPFAYPGGGICVGV